MIISNGNRTECRPIRSVILLITNMIAGLTDRIGRHGVLLPNNLYHKLQQNSCNFKIFLKKLKHDISRGKITRNIIACVQPPLPSEKNRRRGVCDSLLLIVYGNQVFFS